MNNEIKKGRKILLIIALLIILIELLVIVLYIIIVGPNRLPQQVLRLSLTGILLFFLYRGSNLARVVAIVLFTIGGILVFISGLVLSTTTIDYLMILTGAVYLGSALCLLISHPVRVFLKSQRESA